LNVTTDLSFFDLIVPCGIPGGGVTSMQSLLAKQLNLESVADRVIEVFGKVFQRRLVPTSHRELEAELEEFERMHAVV
jgi:lipoyl(octanoyl) transferase